MVPIAERVWAAWRDEVAQWDEPVLRLLLATDAGADAVEVLRESVLEVQDAFEGQAQRTGNPEPPSAGEWEWVRVPDGVLVQVVECEALEVVLPAMAGALERRGIVARFDLADDVSAAPRPTSAHMIECRVRVGGARRERGPRDYLWQADPEAHAQLLAAGERWCRRPAAGESQSLHVGTLDPVTVKPREDVLDRMREAVEDRIHVELCSVAADEFRSVAARPWSGGVSFVMGGVSVETGGWEQPLAELTGLLRDHADHVAYGFVRRGWAVDEAILRDSLAFDWPQRADREPRGIGFTQHAFEDVFAPDAFAVQLLGPGYAGRVPGAPSWRHERAGTGAALLEHVDLPAWFDAPFIPKDDRRWQLEHPEPPAVLARAREELGPILYSPGVLSEIGYESDSEV